MLKKILILRQSFRKFRNFDNTNGDPAADATDISDISAGASANTGKSREAFDDRQLVNRFLQQLITAGWLGEETLADFTCVINITLEGSLFWKP